MTTPMFTAPQVDLDSATKDRRNQWGSNRGAVAHTSGMTLSRWSTLLPLLEKFQTHLASNVPKLEIIAATDKRWSDDDYKQLRPRGFPSNLRGVYLLFGEDETLLYVGLAMWCFDKRVWSHDEWIPRRWTDIISMNDQTIFLAPSLEYWLISHLNPTHNKVYKGYQETLEVASDPEKRIINEI